MNKYFSKVTSLLLAGVMVFAAGCTDVDRDVNDLDKAVSAVEGNLASLEKQLDALEKADSALEAAIKAAKDEAAKLYATKEELATAKSEISSAIKDLEAKDVILDQAISNAVNTATNAINNLEKKHDSDIAALRTSLTEGLTEVKNLIAAQKSTVENLQSQINAHEKDYENYKATTNAALDAIRSTYDTKLADLEELIEKTESTLKGSIAENKQAIAANLASITKNANDIVAIRAEVSKGLNDLEIKVAGMIAAVEAKVQANAAAIEKINEIELPKVKEEIEKSKALIAALQAEDLKLSDAIEALKAQTNANYDALQTSVAALEATVAKNDATVQAYYKELSEKFAGYVTLEAHEADLAELEARIMGELEALEEKLNEKIEAGDNANKELIDANKEAIEANKEAIKNLGEELAAAKDEYLNLVSSLQEQIIALGIVDQDLEARIEAAKQDYTKLISSVMQQISDLNMYANGLEEDIKENADAIALNLKNITANAAEILKIQTAWAETIPALDLALGTLKDRVAEIEGELQSVIDAIALNVTKITTNADAILALQTAWAETIPALDLALGTLHDKVEGIEGDITSINAAIEAIQDYIGEMIPALDLSIGALQAADVKLQESIETAKSALEKSIEALREEIEEAMAKLQEAVDAAIEDIQANTANISDLKDLVAQVRDGAKQDLAEANEAIKYNGECITNLNQQVANLENRVQDLEEALSAIQNGWSQVGTNKDNIEEITNRIQSVVLVPETKVGDPIPAAAFKFDYTDPKAVDFKSGVIFQATYEVTPASAASTLNADNIYFNTVETKAAPAENIYAEVVSASNETGRVIVKGIIAVDKNAYEHLVKGTGDVAVALNVEEGTAKISSAYATVNYIGEFDIKNALVFAEEKDGVYTVKNATADNMVRYVDTEVKDLYPNIDVYAKVDANFMSVEDFSKLVGLPVEYKLTVKTVYSETYDEDFANPFAFVYPAGKELESTGKLVKPADRNLEACIGESATNTLTININGETTTTTLRNNFEITENVITVNFDKYVSEAWDYLNFTTPKVTKYAERRADFLLTDLVYYSDKTTKIVKGNTIPFDVIGTTATGTPYNAGTLDMLVESEKALSVDAVNVPFNTKVVDYVATFKLWDKTTGTRYDISMPIQVLAKPGNATVSETLKLTYNYGTASSYVVDLEKGVTNAISQHSSFYKGVDLELLVNKFMTEMNAQSSLSTFASGLCSQILPPVLQYDAAKKVENSMIQVMAAGLVPGNTNPNAYKRSFSFDVYGVKYTLAYTVSFNTVVFEGHPKYVDGNNVVTLNGTVAYPTEFYNDGVIKAGGTPFKLQNINLSEYYLADESIKKYINDGDLTVNYNYVEWNATTEEWDVIATPTDVNIDANGLVTVVNTYRKSFDFKISLMNGATEVKSFVINVNYPIDPVTMSATAAPVEVTKIDGADTYANVVNGLVITDFNGQSLISPVAKGLDVTPAKYNIWCTYSGVYGYYLYNQIINIDATKITGQLSDGTPLEMSADATNSDDKDFFVNTTTGDVIWFKNDATLLQNATISIPVVLTHDYSGVDKDGNPIADKATVTVVFKK